jgi:hypothetical protein
MTAARHEPAHCRPVLDDLFLSYPLSGGNMGPGCDSDCGRVPLTNRHDHDCICDCHIAHAKAVTDPWGSSNVDIDHMLGMHDDLSGKNTGRLGSVVVSATCPVYDVFPSSRVSPVSSPFYLSSA